MRLLNFALVTIFAAVLLGVTPVSPKSQQAEAQISVGIGLGGPPVCPYG